MTATPFRTQMLQARELAIVSSTNRLLAEKGFDAMTVDEVAADVGIAKASLYKHFASKEELAAAAMVRMLEQTLTELVAIDHTPGLAPVDRLRSLVRWTLRIQLAGEMPSLPSQNSVLRNALLANKGYLDRLLEVSEHIGVWIEAAQADGSLDAALAPELILYTMFAKACDPVLGFLKASGKFSDEQIVDDLVRVCFGGVGAGAGRSTG